LGEADRGCAKKPWFTAAVLLINSIIAAISGAGMYTIVALLAANDGED
jgi:hypothetical protein